MPGASWAAKVCHALAQLGVREGVVSVLRWRSACPSSSNLRLEIGGAVIKKHAHGLDNVWRHDGVALRGGEGRRGAEVRRRAMSSRWEETHRGSHALPHLVARRVALARLHPEAQLAPEQAGQPIFCVPNGRRYGSAGWFGTARDNPP